MFYEHLITQWDCELGLNDDVSVLRGDDRDEILTSKPIPMNR